MPFPLSFKKKTTNFQSRTKLEGSFEVRVSFSHMGMGRKTRFENLICSQNMASGYSIAVLDLFAPGAKTAEGWGHTSKQTD